MLFAGTGGLRNPRYSFTTWLFPIGRGSGMGGCGIFRGCHPSVLGRTLRTLESYGCGEGLPRPRKGCSRCLLWRPAILQQAAAHHRLAAVVLIMDAIQNVLFRPWQVFAEKLQCRHNVSGASSCVREPDFAWPGREVKPRPAGFQRNATGMCSSFFATRCSSGPTSFSLLQDPETA